VKVVLQRRVVCAVEVTDCRSNGLLDAVQMANISTRIGDRGVQSFAVPMNR
jgi:hypothetical protein